VAEKEKIWKWVIGHMGRTYLAMQQLEDAKQCFLRLLAWPGPVNSAGDRVEVLFIGMAAYHRMRKDWIKLRECCEEALVILPHVDDGRLSDQTEEKLLIMLADAAEGEGDMRRAHEYDEKAK